MAKVASSKPYGSGKRNAVPSEASPIRTSPRRKKSGIEEVEAVQPKKKNGSAGIPEPPRFNDAKKQQNPLQPVKTPAKKPGKPFKSPKTPKTPKSSGRRKSALEPVILNEEPKETTEGFEVESSEDELIDYVESINRQDNSPIYEEQEVMGIGENINDEAPGETEYIEERTEYTEETGDFHYDEEEPGGYDQSEGLNESEYNDQFQYTSESVRARLSQYFNRHESRAANNSTATSALTTATGRSQLWNRIKDWISDRVIPGAREIGEYTKKAIEQISRRIESKPEEDFTEEQYETALDSWSDCAGPKIYEITEDEDRDQAVENNKVMDDYEMDFNAAECEAQDSVIESKESSYHSLLAQQDTSLVIEPSVQVHATPEKPFSHSMKSNINSDILDSRLTEIVLFLAKCSPDTPLPAIYEHLEELFTLKGENSLNFTEKQLVSTIIRDFLTENVHHADGEMGGINSGTSCNAPLYEPIVMSGERSNPKRIKVLSSSGIRFRAPQFTPEEEARLDELEQVRLLQRQKSSAKLTTGLATPSQRFKLQKKLLNPESTVEMMETLPETRGRSGAIEKRKVDSISAAIEDIISQKVKETKKREERERLETETLKSRIAELERETRERTTKEALLQKQLAEQKKELEIEREATKSKIESLKAAAVAASQPLIAGASVQNGSSFSGLGVPAGVGVQNAASFNVPAGATSFNVPAGAASFNAPAGAASFSPAGAASLSGQPTFSFMGKKQEEDERAKPVQSSLDTSSTVPSFSFGKIKDENPPPFAIKSEESAQPAFKGFSFVESPKVEVKTEAPGMPEAASKTVNPFATFQFGGKEQEKKDLNPEAPDFKPPNSSFGFSFGSAVKTESKPAGEADIEAKGPETKKTSFGFGGFNASESNFNFGSSVKPASGSDASKPPATSVPAAFNFGSKTTESVSASGNVFNFGSKSVPPSVFDFGANAPGTTGVNPANSSIPASSSVNSSNPFAGLSANTNIFGGGTSFHAPPSFPAVNSFSFGASSSSDNNNNFGFLPATTAAPPIIPMNFGGTVSNPNDPQQQQMEMSFQSGRSISIPRRRRK